MRFLTTRRRHRAARPLLLMVALMLTGLLYATVAPVQRSVADGSTSAQIAQGAGLFGQSCASCHGLNGEGTAAGPTLIGVGPAAVDFMVGTGRMPAATNGVQANPKQNTFTAEEIAAMAAYVASLSSGGVAIPTAGQYDTTGLSAEEIARGGELFRTNCSACHNFQGSGGALPNGLAAPSLLETSPNHIWEAMRIGPGQMPRFSSSTIPDEDVRAMIAYLESLHQQPSGGYAFGGTGPVAEGFGAWLFGIGTLVLFATWIAVRGARAR